MKIDEYLDLLWRERAVAILRTGDAEIADLALRAAIRGGFRLVEVTLTTPDALALIERFAAMPDIVVGAGTVLTTSQAADAVGAGASFLVSPVVDDAVITKAAELGVACTPGTYTPTEMYRAHRAGAPLQKLFPAPARGPAYVRTVLGPMPFLRIVPTSGVDGDNAADYLNAGAYAVGFVAPLFDPRELAERRFDAIEERARALRQAVAQVERGAPPSQSSP